MIFAVILIQFFSIIFGAIATYAFYLEGFFGLRLIFGFIAPIVYIYLFNGIFDASISMLAKQYFLMIAISAAYIFFKKTSLTKKSILKNIVCSPFAISFLILLMLTAWLGGSNYEASRWDEFSHWMMMPKQMFYFDNLVSKNFPFKSLISYTPGWSINQIYPQLVLKNIFIENWLPGATVYSTLTLGIIAYSFVIETMSNFLKRANISHAHLVSWIFVLFLSALREFSIFNQEFLIEVPQFYLLIIVTSFLFLIASSQIQKTVYLAALGVLFVYCYLVKDSFSIVVLSVSVAMLIGRQMSFKAALLSLLPLGVAVLLWKFRLTDFQAVFHFNFNNIHQVLFERREILSQFYEKFVALFAGRRVLFSFLIMIFLFRGKLKLVRNYLSLYFILTSMGLLIMYFTSFGEYEAVRLASFERYHSLPISIVKLTAILVCAYFIIVNIDKFIKSLRFKKYATFILIGILTLAALSDFHRFCMKLNRFSSDVPVLKQAAALTKVMSENKLLGRDVYIISQGTDEFEYYMANYSSFEFGVTSFVIKRELSWGTEPANVWMRKTSEQELINNFLGVPVLWVVKSDDWMNTILKQITNPNTCNDAYEKYFLIHDTDKNIFNCVLKSAT